MLVLLPRPSSKEAKSLALLFLTLTVFWVSLVNLTSASETTLLAVDPARIEDIGLGVNSTFSLSVNVSNLTTNLYGYQFNLHYDTSILSAVGVDSFGPYFDALVSSGLALPIVETRDEEGTITVALTVIGDARPFTGTSTTVASISFMVDGLGQTLLQLQSSILVTVGQDKLISPIPHFTSDGFFSNIRGQPPKASFTIDPTHPIVNQTVSFDASNTTDPDGFIASYSWDFGDGTPVVDASSPLINHTYPAPGGFFITLTVTDNDGNTAQAQGSVNVVLSNLPPVASFTFSPSNPSVGQLVTFDATSSFDPDGFIVDYSWIFGDGTVITFGGPPIVGHFYNQPGFYDVFLYVRDDSRQFSVIDKVVNVTGPSNERPIARFTYSPPVPEAGQLVQFDGTNSTDPDGYILSWSWDFGDFSFGFGPFTSHFYSQPRDYAVTLTVTDNQGATSTAQSTITVVPGPPNIPPLASFRYFPSVPVAGDFVSFESTSTDPDGSISTWFWNFGDGTVGFGPFITHQYFVAGTFDVTLTVTDNRGASAAASQTITVIPRPSHDVGIDFIDVYPRVAASSQFVGVQVGVRNKGLFTETVDLVVYFDSHVAATVSGITLDPRPFPFYITAVWDTLGVAPGNYTISATVFLATDENLSDNGLTDGNVTLLPGPVLTANPSSGSLGTKVVVHGSGFPPPQYGLAIINVSFDDMFVGFIISREGEFDFVFNIPHAEPGLHHIKALDTLTGARAILDFSVLAEPGVSVSLLAISVDVGVVYFPGDTADIYVLTTLNGTPADSQLELVVIKPDGSRVTLTATSVSSGSYKASLSIPRTGSTGTYAVLATASGEGVSVSALRVFEVKQSWITTQGPRIASATAVVGMVAALALAWKNGVFRKRDEDPLPGF